jgi:hypothetical protein
MNKPIRFHPRRRIPDDLLPDAAEAQWISGFKIKWQDKVLQDIAQTCCNGFRPTADETQCALSALQRAREQHDWRLQAVAAWILGFVEPTPDFLEELATPVMRLVAPNDSPFQRTMDSSQRALRRTLPMTAIAGGVLMSQFYGTIPSILTGFALGAGAGYFLFPFFLPVSVMIDRRQRQQIQLAALSTLRRWRDPRVIGSVARAAIGSDEVLLRDVQKTLDCLLSCLTPTHYGMMPAGTTSDLCRALDYANEAVLWDYRQSRPFEPYVPLAKSLLAALEMIGSGEAAKTVRTVIAKGHQQSIIRAAKRVLPTLEQREQEETARYTLLRQSHAPDTPSELLRPAVASTPEQDAQTLLRPSL